MMASALLGLAVLAALLLAVAGFLRAKAAREDVWALRREFMALRARLEAIDAGPPPTPMPRDAPPSIIAAALAAPPEASPISPPAPPPADLETLLTARWGVWLGACALLLAGIFLIRFGVEQNLLGPATRCAMAALLGIGLLAAGELLFRRTQAVPRDGEQASAALAAGGIASLFGAAYGAGPFYGLLPLAPAFAAMVACSAAGLVAALRYGALTAAIGIAGGFVSPALVASANPSLPGLFLYLAVLSAAALWILRRTAWVWLNWSTAIAGAMWLCAAALQGGPDIWAAAAFMPAAVALHLFLLPEAALDHPLGARLSWLPMVIIASAGGLLAAETPGLAPRLALFALSPIAIWRGIGQMRLDRLSWIAALFGLLALLLWAAPGVDLDDLGQLFPAVLINPADRTAVRQFLIASLLFGAFHAGAGLVLERRLPHPSHWAALPAAVPVLTLAVAFAQVGHAQTSVGWSATGMALALGLCATAAGAARRGARDLAGIHAAGAAAATALGCAMLLQDQWLTFAIALLLPALAWIEARADLPALRQVGIAIAALVLIRLALNWYVLDYMFGPLRLAGGLVVAYALPALSFATAAILFRRRADDTLVATLEAGACSLGSAFVAMEIRQAFGGESIAGSLSFAETALHLLTIAVQATVYLIIARRTGRAMLTRMWQILGVGAVILGTVLVLANPGVTNAEARPATLLIAYLVPAGLAAWAESRQPPSRRRDILGAYALTAGLVWITLQIRQVFHPDGLGLIEGRVDDAELWAWSGGWLIFGLGLMAYGAWAARRRLRLAALAVIGLVCAKVFLIDMSDLAGIWRVLSFLGLGLGLIGLSLIGRWLAPGAQRRP